ncbi:MAG TPA: HAD-IB family phosphatase [Candidatus Limnocylindrales bacterium]
MPGRPIDPSPPAAPTPASVPPLRPGQPPIAILVDYDGTIALVDVSDTVLADHVPGEWEALDELYLQGLVGSRRLIERQVSLLRGDPQRIAATAAAQPHDPAFAPFAERARELGVPVEVVSDGFGFFIAPALASLGLADLPIATARTTLAPGPPEVEFPYGHPACFVCGTCKRERVLAHQAAGRFVVFVGDGESDRYAAAHADVVFAKRYLARVCDERGWAYTPWHDFGQIDAWLSRAVDAWRADPASLPGPTRRAYICGPEVWGPGRSDPPAADDVRLPPLPGDAGVPIGEPASPEPSGDVRGPDAPLGGPAP